VRYGVLLALAAAVVAAVAASSGSASGPSSQVKNADACLQLQSDPVGTCSTGTLPAGSTVTLALTLTNEQSSNTVIGSANLDAPVGFTIHPATAAPASIVNLAGSTGSELQLRNMNIAPGGAQTITFPVDVPCTATAANWGLRVKQSNNFSGSPGNDFNIVSKAGLSSTTAAGTPAAVAFSSQPPSLVKTATTFSAAVSLEDACGNTTSGSGSLSLSLNQPTAPVAGGGGSLSGGGAVTPTSTTSFDNLSVSAPGIGYTLTATFTPTSGSPITADSSAFDVLDVVSNCANGCSGDASDTTSTDLNVTAPDTSGLLGLSLAGQAPAGTTCQLLDGSTKTLTPLGQSYLVVPPTRPAGTKDYFNIQVQITLLKRALQGVGVSNIKVCKNVVGSSGAVIMQQVPPCPSPAKKWLTSPTGAPNACIVSQTSDNAGDAVITMLINSVDPHGFTGG
jgi:hypothetical protein